MGRLMKKGKQVPRRSGRDQSGKLRSRGKKSDVSDDGSDDDFQIEEHDEEANDDDDDDDDDDGDVDIDEDEADHGGFVSVKTDLLVDDWEDGPYLQRLRDHYDNVSEEEKGTVKTDFGTEVDTSVWSKMFDYQKDGVRWMFKMYRDGVGGILADEMGLGKTCQLSVHFGSLARMAEYDSGVIDESTAPMSGPSRSLRPREHASAAFLIVCPATVLQHWLKELHTWAPSLRAVILHSMSVTGGELCRLGIEKIQLVIRRVQRLRSTRGLVVLVTYEGMRTLRDALCAIEWTAVCLDEGHRVRNPNAEISKVCKLVPCYHRLILSGTPIQNTLTELWSLFDFIYPGRLGTLPVFQAEFCDPIRAGGYAGANALKVEIATKTASILQRIVKPYLLRRRKDQVALPVPLPEKTEHVIFCSLTSKQRDMYIRVLDSPEVEAVILNRMMPFRAISTLRKLCNHPCLLTEEDQSLLSSDTYSSTGRLKRRATMKSPTGYKNHASSAATDIDSGSEDEAINPNVNWADSGKLNVLSKILPMWQQQGHKVLLFSQTRSMLNVLEILFRKHFNFRYLRLDGSTAVSKRSSIIERFNTDPSIFLILLTTRTGGVGVSLTGADRVLLLDPDWNPQVDLQSRERAWRLGQQRPVTVYRLITRGTIEEKIYERQIFKIMLSNRILLDPKQKALVSKSLLKELFTLTDFNFATTAAVQSSRSSNRKSNTSTEYDEEYLSFPSAGLVDIHTNATNSSASSSSSAVTAVGSIGDSEENVIADVIVSDNHDDFQVTATDMFSSASILPSGADECADEDDGADDEIDEEDEDTAGVASGKDMKKVLAAKRAHKRLMRRLHTHDAPVIPRPLPLLQPQSEEEDGEVRETFPSSATAASSSCSSSSSLRATPPSARPGAPTAVPVTVKPTTGSLDDNSLIVIRKVRIQEPDPNELETKGRSKKGKENISVKTDDTTAVPTQKVLSDDKELLQLLFSDKVISSVYDHEYLESGGVSKSKGASSLEKEASRKVESALLTLQKSAPAYIPPVNPSTGVSSSSSSAQQSSSSSTLLANIRKRKQEGVVAVPAVGEPATNVTGTKVRAPEVILRRSVYTEHSRAPSAVMVRAAMDRVKDSAQKGGNLEECGGGSLHGTIARRIRTLFQQRGPQLTTEYLLRQFSDLGDQYAVVFRSCLKQCARKVGSGLWEEI